jgi:5'-nucleotidase
MIMSSNLTHKLVMGISSRALFNLDESHRVFQEQGLEAYLQYQIQRENEILAPGVAFGFVKKLLDIKHPLTDEHLVEVILLSRNSADTGLRIFNSIAHHELPITRAAFSNGRSPYRYISAFKMHLFLSAHAEDVRHALEAKCAAATLLPSCVKSGADHHQLKIAFDGDSVLFSDEAERIFQTKGLDAFKQSELESAKKPLNEGPFKGFLSALHQIQKLFPIETCPIRTALVTARDAPAHERVIHTLRNWDIRIDEALFLGGLTKAEFLKAFEADIFFDDQDGHCQSAAKEHVATGHVPHGVTNDL